MALGSLIWPVLLSAHPKRLSFDVVRQVTASKATRQRSPKSLEPKNGAETMVSHFGSTTNSNHNVVHAVCFTLAPNFGKS
ncbi:hypothetical protein BDV36DRAFT_266251 [Aspergillus pseudocaelatus]|uniref:Secreted protein n=1 Tax=Aspergillus pseudocaelatus TaxID=1825620 RepID=A0ABQ6WAE0_9EURO|nr:hypothetical protein BDV36DRAFT_266251 [Aspergillus pseudocaelatus]